MQRKLKIRYKIDPFSEVQQVLKSRIRMSDEPVIIVNSLSKTYKLYYSHRDRIKEAIHPLRKCYHKKYQALKDVSIKVEKGEVIGIIGQNGSGKSTLLKILASVVTPTSGNFKCNGRLTALLELGGGFKKELSGVDNIFFLGGVQGFKRSEMRQRLKEILDFADIGVYADQPVKSYSSGMYVRLTFSMAINIDPDILIIDEALAVGDIRFQQKCFRKIREFKDQGKTIIFCSHNLNAVRDFCTRAIWLHDGNIREMGDPIFVTDCYSKFMATKDESQHISKTGHAEKLTDEEPIQISGKLNTQNIEWDSVSHCDSYGIGGAVIQYVALYNTNEHTKISTLSGGEDVRIYIQLLACQHFQNPGIMLLFNGRFGTPVFKVNSFLFPNKLFFEVDKPTILAVDFKFPKLGNGNYSISMGIHNAIKDLRSDLHWVHDAILVDVYNPDNKYKQGTQLVIDMAQINVIPSVQ